MVGPEMGQCLVDGGVEPCRDQSILEAGAFRTVVEHIVGCDHRHIDFAGEGDQLPVACGVPLQKVVVKLDVHRVRAVPLGVAIQEGFERLRDDRS